MQPQISAGILGGAIGLLLVLVYLACIIGLTIYVLRLLGRFVRAHERVAGAAEAIAQKLANDAKG
jgi:TRAP-type C4-dicarboxylate transport system permease small subunit